MSHFHQDDACEWFRERQELFLDGELSGAENFRFQQHLKECEDCAAYWAIDEALAERLLVQFAVPLEGDRLLPPDENYQPRIPRVGEIRPVTHHSTTVVLDGGRRLFFATLAAVAACVLVMVLVLDGAPAPHHRPRLVDGPAVVTVARAPVSRIYPQGRVDVRLPGADWRPLAGAGDIVAGTELRCDRDSRILVDLGDQDHFVLGENSTGRVDLIGDSLRLEILRGRFSCDLGHRDLRVLAAGLEVAGHDVAFDLRSSEGDVAVDYESRIAVTRGELQARSDVGTARKLVGGDVYAVRDGLLVAFSRLESDFNEATLATKPRGSLRVELSEAPTDIAVINGANVAMPLASARPRIEGWLDGILASGGLNIVDPDASSRRMIERIGVWGDSVLPDIESLFRASSEPQARRALIGLVSDMSGPAVLDFLIAAGSDLDLSVRKASLLVLSRRDDVRLAEHFVDVMRREQNADLKLSAAFLAAAMGESSGLVEMRAIHDAATKSEWRNTVVTLVTRLDPATPGRDDFLLTALENFDLGRGPGPLQTLLSALARTGDAARFERVLHALQTRPGIKPAEKRLIDSALAR